MSHVEVWTCPRCSRIYRAPIKMSYPPLCSGAKVKHAQVEMERKG